MPRYVIIHRPEDIVDRLWDRKEGDYEHPEEAVRMLLTDEQIMDHEYVVYEVANGIHSDEFHHDGTFDDIAEKLD